MKYKKWTPEEDQILQKFTTESIGALAMKLGRSIDSVQNRKARLGLTERKQFLDSLVGAPPEKIEPEVPTTFEEDLTEAKDNIWQARCLELERKYAKSIKENALVQQLVDEIKDMAPQSYDPAPPITHGPERSGTAVQSAVLLFSDTHIGKVVLPSQTLGMGCYNFSVFCDRLKYLEESVVSILDNHTTMKVEELVVAMLGDMLDGALSHGVEAGLRNTLFAQFYNGAHAIAQFFRVLAAHVPVLRIETVVGNHTRWQNQHKMPTENRYSNLDSFLYALVEALTHDIPNIKWNLTMQPFAIFEVQGWTFYASHGDHLRGGDKALGIPNHAIGRQISTSSQLFAKNGKQSPHYYVSGHLHRSIQLPHALGDVTINGGFPGLDNYALAEAFNPVDPTQTLFFLHPRYGKTAEYKLSLKFAESSGKCPYTLPTNFPIE